ncbi:biotin/lipoyl-containing protein [Pseudomonas sp. LB3P14]
MNADDIEKLTALVSKMPLKSFEYHEDDCHLSLVFNRSKAPAGKVVSLVPEQHSAAIVRSPGMGFIKLTHPQQRNEFIPLGSSIEKGQILGFLQVGDLLEGVVSPQAGTLSKVLVAEGDLVGYADPIFEIQ